MSTCLDRTTTWTSGRSPLGRLVAYDVYDGPVAGVALCRTDAASLLFRMQSWDERQRARVFSMAPVPERDVTDFLSRLAELGTPRWPEWWLPAPPDAETRQLIDSAAAQLQARAGQVEWIILTDDLLGGSGRCVHIVGPSLRSACEALSRRATPNAEVSEGSFDQWLDLIERASSHPDFHE